MTTTSAFDLLFTDQQERLMEFLIEKKDRDFFLLWTVPIYFSINKKILKCIHISKTMFCNSVKIKTTIFILCIKVFFDLTDEFFLDSKIS